MTHVVQALGSTISQYGDLVARYGGEEFVAILPETDLPGAIAMATEMQTQVKHLKLPHACSSVSYYVTISMGVVSLIPSLEQSSQVLFAAVDRLIYEAKQAGRNQIRHDDNL